MYNIYTYREKEIGRGMTDKVERRRRRRGLICH